MRNQGCTCVRAGSPLLGSVAEMAWELTAAEVPWAAPTACAPPSCNRNLQDNSSRLNWVHISSWVVGVPVHAAPTQLDATTG
jgi:hypothetical protein